MPKKTIVREEVKVREIDVFFEPNRMIFEVDGKKYAMPKRLASFLFGRNVEVEFEKTVGEDDDFAEIHNLKNIVLWQFLKGDRNFPTEMIAKEIGTTVPKLLRWTNRMSHAFGKMMAQSPHETEEFIREFNEKYASPEIREVIEVPNLDVEKVAKAFLEAEKDLTETAKRLNLPKEKFLLFWNKNLHLINRQVRAVQ